MPRSPEQNTSVWLHGAGLLLMAGVFLVDLMTPLGYAIPMLYAMALLVTWRVPGGNSTVLYVTGMMVLTWVGGALSPGGWTSEAVINRIMASGLLVVVAGLVIQQKQAMAETVATQDALRRGNDALEQRVAQRTAALRESEERLHLVLRGANLGLWDWNVRSGQVVFNERWAEMLGYRLEDIEPHVRAWEQLVHPDDLPAVRAVLRRHLNGELPYYHTEHRMRTKQGEWKWVLDAGQVVERDASGKPLRATGIHKDITERKHVEEVLRQSQAELRQQQVQLENLTARLLTAQEAERQRIARELHDDISQRLAALVLDLASLEQHPPLLPERVAHTVTPLREQLERLSDDVHNLAYHLHPSLLAHAGLQPAIEEHIHDITRRTGLPIMLKVKDVPASLPLDQATALYRVMQESVQNVVKHAEASEVKIRLSGSSKGVGLSVMDNGRGFDTAGTLADPKGLGLISMQERLRLADGLLRVHSLPRGGTKVCAWIPSREAAA